MAKYHWWSSSCGRIEIKVPDYAIPALYHSGDCESSVREVLDTNEYLRKQVLPIPPETLKTVIAEAFGDITTAELEDHTMNQVRLLWMAGGDLFDTVGSALATRKRGATA